MTQALRSLVSSFGPERADFRGVESATFGHLMLLVHGYPYRRQLS
jgi:hypothetical protein